MHRHILIVVLALASAALTLTSQVQAQTPAYVGYAFADQPSSSSYTPHIDYAFNGAGGPISIGRAGRGKYSVTFTGLGGNGQPGGNVQVTALGADSAACKIQHWVSGGADFIVLVRCFDDNESSVDSRFLVQILEPDAQPKGMAYALGHPAGGVISGYAYNSTGQTILAARGGPGFYKVRFLGLGGLDGGHLEVTAVGTDASRCKISGWSSAGSELIAKVLCFKPNGLAADSAYAVQVIGPKARPRSLAYAWADNPTAAAYAPNPTYAYNSSAGTLTVSRNSAGIYVVQVPGLGGGTRPGGHVQATAFGGSADHCKVSGWNSKRADIQAKVLCFDPAGRLVDSHFGLKVHDAMRPPASPWIAFRDDTPTRLSLAGGITTADTAEKDIAAADFDQNGWTDLVVVRKLPFSVTGAFQDLLLLNFAGVLTDSTATMAPGFLSAPTDARDVAVIDFDQDGWQDLIIANTFGQQPKLYQNKGRDSFGQWAGFKDASNRLPFIGISPLQFCAVAVGDVDGDGAPDIYFSNYASNGIALDVLLINDGSGNFRDESQGRLGQHRNSGFGTSVEMRDLEGDGDLDIVKTSTLTSVPPWNRRGIFVLPNNGAGVFKTWTSLPTSQPYMFTIADFSGNGLLDAYVVDDNQDYMDWGTPTPLTFNRQPLVTSPRTANFGGNVKASDLDGDGDLDIGVADVDVDIPGCNRVMALLENPGGGGLPADPFTSPQPWHQSTFDFALLDINRDGELDLFLAGCPNATSQGYSVYTQIGSP